MPLVGQKMAEERARISRERARIEREVLRVLTKRMSSGDLITRVLDALPDEKRGRVGNVIDRMLERKEIALAGPSERSKHRFFVPVHAVITPEGREVKHPGANAEDAPELGMLSERAAKVLSSLSRNYGSRQNSISKAAGVVEGLNDVLDTLERRGLVEIVRHQGSGVLMHCRLTDPGWVHPQYRQDWPKADPYDIKADIYTAPSRGRSDPDEVSAFRERLYQELEKPACVRSLAEAMQATYMRVRSSLGAMESEGRVKRLKSAGKSTLWCRSSHEVDDDYVVASELSLPTGVSTILQNELLKSLNEEKSVKDLAVQFSTTYTHVIDNLRTLQRAGLVGSFRPAGGVMVWRRLGVGHLDEQVDQEPTTS